MQSQKNVPELTTKDIAILEDQLNYEALANKKCRAALSGINDENTRTSIEQIAQHHKQHFDELLSYLKSHK